MITGVLITRTDRTLVSKQIEAEVRNYFGPLVYDRVVPSSVKFREAYARGIPLIRYDRFSAGAEAYRAAARAFLGQAATAGRRGRGRRPHPAAVDDDGPWIEDRRRTGSTVQRTGVRARAAGGMTDERRDTTRRDPWSREPDRPGPAGHDRGRVRAPAARGRSGRSGRIEQHAGRDRTRRASPADTSPKRVPGRRRARRGPAPADPAAKPRRVQRMFALEEELDKKLWLYAIHVGKDRSEVVNDLLRPLVASMVLYDSRDRRGGRAVDPTIDRGVEAEGETAA